MPPRQVLLDGAILPAGAWSFDPARHVLAWQSGSNGTRHQGQLQLASDLCPAPGTITIDGTTVAVVADLPPISYTCAIARNTGAYVTGVAPALQLHWDAASASWTGAEWQQDVLRFTYQMQQQTIVGQTFYGFSLGFADMQTGAAWTPDAGTFGCLIDANFVFAMTLQGGLSPPPDNRGAQPGEAGQITTVFPFQIAFQLSATAIDIQGAALTVTDAQSGVTLGVSGSTATPSICGYYARNGSDGVFAIHDGTLFVVGAPVAGSQIRGTDLVWQGLDINAQQASGLPARGRLQFDAAGERFTVADVGTEGRRVVGDAAEALINRGAGGV
jgi:hypothetical protein